MILILPDDLDALDDLDIKTAFRCLKHDEGHHVPKEVITSIKFWFVQISNTVNPEKKGGPQVPWLSRNSVRMQNMGQNTLANDGEICNGSSRVTVENNRHQQRQQ